MRGFRRPAQPVYPKGDGFLMVELPYLGALPYDESLEDAIGDPPRLARTPFAAGVRELSDSLSIDAK